MQTQLIRGCARSKGDYLSIGGGNGVRDVVNPLYARTITLSARTQAGVD